MCFWWVTKSVVCSCRATEPPSHRAAEPPSRRATDPIRSDTIEYDTILSICWSGEQKMFWKSWKIKNCWNVRAGASFDLINFGELKSSLIFSNLRICDWIFFQMMWFDRMYYHMTFWKLVAAKTKMFWNSWKFKFWQEVETYGGFVLIISGQIKTNLHKWNK